tara:strand:+ start:357 stop:899 length:543 start_codon:yes stop_codon:yes gene_type:complete
MRILFIFLLLIGSAHAEVTTCNGEFALCAASTCQPTGKMITVNGGLSYPEVVCKCPILNGKAIADPAIGNMKGSCAPTDKDHVWSLFAPQLNYPQEASNWSKLKKNMKVTVQKCDGSLNQGANASNCFSFNCKKGPNGIADCKCPMAQMAVNTTFLTEAGQGNPEACYQHPVSAPAPTAK